MSPPYSNPITRELNRIQFHRLDHPACVSSVINHLYQGIKAGFLDFILDFRGTQTAYPNVCAPLASIIDFYTAENIEFDCRYAPRSYLERTCVCSPANADDQNRLAAGSMDRVWMFTSTSIGNVVDSMVKELEHSPFKVALPFGQGGIEPLWERMRRGGEVSPCPATWLPTGSVI
jgi:hypothetical protein